MTKDLKDSCDRPARTNRLKPGGTLVRIRLHYSPLIVACLLAVPPPLFFYCLLSGLPSISATAPGNSSLRLSCQPCAVFTHVARMGAVSEIRCRLPCGSGSVSPAKV